jgi:undecaprenyl phosphate-alpha-L-ara4FN deformylase
MPRRPGMDTIQVGLRVDVDTFRGTRDGVPPLCALFARHAMLASFFFSVGPDNMGRHLWRLVRPTFLWKMLRTRATRLYGWDILLKGTLWPGPVIGEKLGHIMRATAEAGHEVGLHAWDHYAWQTHLEMMDHDTIHQVLHQGVALLTDILGYPPTCSAAAAWKAHDLVLLAKSGYPFVYNSDCRGDSVFSPVVHGTRLAQPQIPVTLPTYDEVIGRQGIGDTNYNDYLLALLRPGRLNVLTVHAEVEGRGRLDLFARFIERALAQGVSFVPLGALLSEAAPIGTATLRAQTIPGRDGWVACQQATMTPETES